MRPDDEQLLKKVRIFDCLAPAMRSRLIRAGKIRTFPKDTVLWKEGRRVKVVYVLLAGRAGIFDVDENQTTVIDLFHPGAVIAGGPALQDMPYLFSAKTVDEVRALVVPIHIYRRYLRTNYSLLFETAVNIVRQWRQLMVQVRNLKQLSANQRLGFYLLALTDRGLGSATVQLIDDQLLIAGILGVTRESLSRSFAQLRRHGVSKRGRIVTLKDIRRLRKFCDDGGLAWPA
jgi:CRP/FNR family transcriptional activator FtrB